MGDLISRDALKKAIEDLYRCDWDEIKKYVFFADVIDNLPSAEPERMSMVWKPAKGRPAYEKGICSCGYVLSVLQRDFVYCPMCGAKLDWSE